MRAGSGAAGRGAGAVELAGGEFSLTMQDFRAITAMLREDAGIALPDSKATLVYSRLAKRLRALGLPSFGSYCTLVASQAGAAERGRMLAALTTNVTRFFREPHHFDHLRVELLPPLLRSAEGGGAVRLWSAACSTGEEAYSLALTVLETAPGAADWDVRILATDIDPDVVAAARAGRYDDAQMEAVPASGRRWFTRGDGGWAAGPALRRLVSVRVLNLHAAWPMRGRFDAILCRNVAIYFDEETQAALWQRFAPALQPGGHLYIGHSERIGGPAAALFETKGITAYRLRGAAA